MQPPTPTGHVFIATSLDGFIARPDGGLDWLTGFNAAGEDHGYDAFIAGMDGICMGRGTFETVAGFDPWPYALPVILLSRTLQPAQIPPHLASRVTLAASPAAALAHASAQGWRRLYIDGGATIRAFMAIGAVQDLVISRVPVLLGAGLPLFGAAGADLPVQHVHTAAFPSGLVQSRYRL